ncbi:Sedlin [Athelia psychrophila]|uniref:Trafficking protein particle complex subunit 2-like protein n=1 Tax=Athelia psychrophila TaxID=1759441 RepID=A0A166VPA1_9AGAM|nr:Sedlin [Fibularhizoctonia sp. CBS 109695]
MPLKLNAVAFISSQNHPILIRTFSKQDELKYHYIAHTSLDVIEERANSNTKTTECYLGLLYAMEDVAVYGYITTLKTKIVLAIALSDSVVLDAEIITIFRALHMAFYTSISNPFLKLDANDPALLVGGAKWKGFRRRVDEIARVVGVTVPLSSA